MKNWIEPAFQEIPQELRERVGGHPLVLQTLMRRGMQDADSALAFLDRAFFKPVHPNDFPDMEKAVERLVSAIQRGERILVWGDFDVDGQTATSLLVSAIKESGGKVAFHIPIRAEESHGVHAHVLQDLLDQKKAEPIHVLLTCDTGINSFDAVDYANQQGVEVIITDHHEPEAELPAAYAIVTPRLLAENHPSRSLPGVGVAYKLVESLFSQFGKQHDPTKFLDLVALGIVADVANISGETRYLLQCGLEQLRVTPRPGLRAAMELAELNPSNITEEHISFILAPRLNALGRLADANLAVELLTTEDPERARLLAYQLEGLNSRRQLLTSQILHSAEAQIEQDPSLLDQPILLLTQQSWPPGVIGVVASRLVEKYNKPTILIAAPPGGIARGSARSTPDFDIVSALGRLAPLLVGYGGHKMAAGFSIEADHIPELRRALSELVPKPLQAASATLEIDGILPLREVNQELVTDIERLAPFGAGNPPLTLISPRMRLIDQASIGRNSEHLALTIEDEANNAYRVIWWQGADFANGQALPEGWFDLAYSVRNSSFRGQRVIQIEWIDARPLPNQEKVYKRKKRVEVLDYRGQDLPLHLLQNLYLEENAQIWAEGDDLSRLIDKLMYITELPLPHHRLELTSSSTLVIWTTPPGPEVFRKAIKSVSPKRMVIFAVNPVPESDQVFLSKLAGMVKYALRVYGGKVHLEELAARLGEREACIRAGIEYLAAQGSVVVLGEDQSGVSLAKGNQKPCAESTQRLTQLRSLLEESLAFRSFFARAPVDSLLALDD